MVVLVEKERLVYLKDRAGSAKLQELRSVFIKFLKGTKQQKATLKENN